MWTYLLILAEQWMTIWKWCRLAGGTGVPNRRERGSPAESQKKYFGHRTVPGHGGAHGSLVTEAIVRKGPEITHLDLQ